MKCFCPYGFQGYRNTPAVLAILSHSFGIGKQPSRLFLPMAILVSAAPFISRVEHLPALPCALVKTP
jgi:hypothetical protein